MSAPENEPREPEQDPELEPTPADDDNEAAEDQEPQTPAEAATTDGSAELTKKLERAIGDQRKRLEKIMGMELAGSECPTCDGTGYVPGGAPAELTLRSPDKYVRCDVCGGPGAVDSKSLNPDYNPIMCDGCSGRGYNIVTETPAPISYLPSPPEATPQPVAGVMGADGVFVPFGQAPTVPPQPYVAS